MASVEEKVKHIIVEQLGVDEDEASVRDKALAAEKVRGLIQGKDVKKVIYVKGKLVNIVAK